MIQRVLFLLCTIVTGVTSHFASEVLASDALRSHVLFQAIERCDVQMLEALLRQKSPPDVRSLDGSTPLMLAAKQGSHAMVKLLLAHGANPRAVNGDGVTALIRGARYADIVQILLEHGSDPNGASALGNTPLIIAAAAADGRDAVRELLAHGADVTTANHAGRTALRMACSGGNTETVRLLIQSARNQNSFDSVIEAAGPIVASAAGNGFTDIVDILLECGADPDRDAGSRGSAVNQALLGGHFDIARTLMIHGAGFDSRTQPGGVPTVLLSAYSETDDPTVASLLRECAADFTRTSESDETALTWARLRGHPRLIDSLTAAGTPEGRTPERVAIPSRPTAADVDQPAAIVGAVQRSVNLLQRSSDTFLDVRRNCVSCHHQNLPAVAIAWARDRGFAVRPESLERMITRQVSSWKPRIERAYQLDSPFPVPPRFLGYGMWCFAELGYRRDELTAAVNWYLTATQQPDGRWVSGMLRPPMGDGDLVATVLALRSLQLYPLVGMDIETTNCVERALRWLQEAQPRTHQEHVYRALGLAWAGVNPESLADEILALRNAQRDDGGWAQLPGLKSDAWATGQTLVAMTIAGGIPVADPTLKRGRDYLLKTQFDDGSWYVQSRSWPFQPYFESEFPFGRDQWISASATAWAVMALTLAVESEDVARLNPPVPDQSRAHNSVDTGSLESASVLPPTSRASVDFAGEIQPLLARSCLECHGDAAPESGFSVTSRAALLRGGDSEFPAVIPGSSGESPLVRFVSGIVPGMEMPPLDVRDDHPPLTPAEISRLRGWIDQGALWPAAGSSDQNSFPVPSE